MKKIQEEMIARFRERFVLDPARVFFGDLEELKRQGWEVGKSQLIIKQDVKPKEFEAFLLEWSEKFLQEPRQEFTKEEYMLFEHMKRAWLNQANSETHKEWFKLLKSLDNKVRKLKMT